MAKARQEHISIQTYNSDTPQGWEVLKGFENYYIDENDKKISISEGINFNLSHILSEEDWIRFGFYPYVEPEHNTSIEKVDSIEFDEDNLIYNAVIAKKEWYESLPSMKTRKISSIKNSYNQILSQTDWIIIRNIELGVATDQSILDERAALRVKCATQESEINALTTIEDVVLYELPEPELV
jgi:hypothetical protein